MARKAALQLSVNFLVILIICIVIFSSGVYVIKRFFSHAETITMTYDERTEKEIERLLDDGSRIAIPFDKKVIYNGEFKTFGIGVLNMLNTGPANKFNITIKFKKAFDKGNEQICQGNGSCGPPDTWLQTTSGDGAENLGVSVEKTIKNNAQEKFLLGVGVKSALPGTYIFDLDVIYFDSPDWEPYDTLHKLYVEVP